MLLGAGGAQAGGVSPLAVLDAGTGENRNVRIVGAPPPVVEIQGVKLFDLAPGRNALPMQWDPKFPNPAFPAVDTTDAPRKSAEAPKLVLDLDQKALGLTGTQSLAFVVTVYDMPEGNAAASRVTMTVVSAGSKKPATARAFILSGDPYVKEPVFGARFLNKTALAERMLLDDAVEKGDVAFQCPSHLYIQRIEVYRLPAPAAGSAVRQPPGTALDAWKKDLSDLIVEQGHAYADWIDAVAGSRALARHVAWLPAGVKAPSLKPMARLEEALAERVSQSLLAVDRFYYDGKAAFVRQDETAYQDLCQAARQVQRRVSAAALDVDRITQAAERDLVVAMAKHGRPVMPGSCATLPERGGSRAETITPVRFSLFSNCPWDTYDPYNVAGLTAPLFGIRSKSYLLGSPALNADGTINEAMYREKDYYRQNERGLGWDVMWAVGHHTDYIMHAHMLLKWFLEKVPDPFDKTYDGKNGGLDFWNPAVCSYFQDVLTRLADRVKGDPEVYPPWFYWGESMGCRGYSLAARKAFPEYLKERFGAITNLNSAWGTTNVSFEEIVPPPPMETVLRTNATGLAYEFERFRREGLVRWVKDAGVALRKGNPQARFWLEGWGRYDYLLNQGMDQYALFQASDLSACHTGSMGQDAQRPWQLALSEYSGTPQSDGEINIYGPWYNGFCDMNMLRAAAESSVLMQSWYGVRQYLFWYSQFLSVRVPSYAGCVLYDENLLSPLSPSCFAVRTVRAKTDLYDSIVKAAHVVHSPVAILYSSTSFINSWPYNEVEHETYPLHAWLFHSDYGYSMVHEDALVDGKEDLHSYQVVLAPWAMWLQPEAAEVLLSFVKRGGVLIGSGPVGAFDPWGKPLNTILDAALGKVDVAYAANERLGDNRLSDDSIARLRALGDEQTTHFGGVAWSVTQKQARAEARVILKLADGTPVAYEAPLGQGKVIVATGSLGKNGLRRFVMSEIETRAVPLVRKTRDDGLHVLPRMDDYGHLFLGIFNQNAVETVADTLYVDGRFENVSEVGASGNWPVPTRPAGTRTAIALKLAPGEGTVLALGSRLDANPVLRDRQRPVTPESPLVSVSDDDLARAETSIRSKTLEPQAAAEAQALLLAARRYRSFGYFDRARRLLDQALKVRTAGEVFFFPEDVVKASRARGAIVIDGNADEWRAIPRYAVKGDSERGGEFALQWDADNLYVLAVVRDADLRDVEEKGNGANWLWLYDGIQLVLNTADSAPLTVGGALYDAKYRATQTALCVSITGRKYANSPSGFSAAATRSAVRKVEGGYVMEVALPLRDVMLPAQAGANAGLLFSIVDYGSGMGFTRFCDREGWLGDPLHFGRLVLVAGKESL
ncbi:MAG: sugar-binding protein [Kiritimatiellae bacterium]|nr:sugar-binding protein [Kiritimatiellia bacterium]